MRTPADCINALNGCVRAGSGIGNMRLAVHETIVADIIAHLQRISWKPIDTAPKNEDGEPKLLLASKSGFRSIGYWEPQAQWGPSWHDGYHNLHPAHWMHLPEQPK